MLVTGSTAAENIFGKPLYAAPNTVAGTTWAIIVPWCWEQFTTTT